MMFDPLSPEMRADPYPMYEMLLSHAPRFFWEPWGMWFVSSHADCQALLRDNRLGHAMVGEVTERQRPLWEMQSNWLLSMNPPDHTRLRSLVHKAFTPRTVLRLRETIEQTTLVLIDRVRADGRMELISDFAYPLPMTIICELLGVPAADHDAFHVWSDDIARSVDMTDDESVYDRAADSTVALTAYLGDLLDERRRRPQADLVSDLVAVEEAGDRLTREELFATCALLLIAGHETTVNLIGNGTLALLRHPDQWRRLKEEPEIIATAVEELLRYDSPVQFTSRVALEPLQIDDLQLEAGSVVGFVLGAANRDPQQFERPERLDLGRTPNRHLAFGGGIHYCLGAPLARLEGEIAFATLARELPGLQLAQDEIEYKNNLTLRGLTSLDVTF